MRVDSLEELVNYIINDIMKDEYDRYLTISFGKEEIIMHVFESEIPIVIKYHEVYDNVNPSPYKKIFAEVYAELLRENIGTGWLKELDEICTAIEQNQKIFEKLLKKGE